jgi:adenine/guanine phosphoribosyltransferase-like PRPP-binding protein
VSLDAWSNGKWTICKAYDEDGKPRFMSFPPALGYPRGESTLRGNLDAFKALADWLLREGFKCVAGPVLSGAQMAYAVSLASEGQLKAVYIPKKGYSPTKHHGSMSFPHPYALIDDIVETGDSMAEAVRYAVRLSGGMNPAAIIADLWCSGVEMAEFKDRLWTVRPGNMNATGAGTAHGGK